MRRSILRWPVSLFILCSFVAPGYAQKNKSTSLRVMVVLKEDKAKPNPLETPKKTDKIKDDKARESRRLKRKNLADLAAKRIKRRLYAAGIKSVKVESKRHGEISIKAFGITNVNWLTGVIIPPGKFGVHPLQDAGHWWKDLAGNLPKGIRLKSPSGKAQTKSYLWSADGALLKRFLKRISLPDVQLGVVPDKKGWRSVVYQSAILDEAFLSMATQTKTRTGRPFVSLSFKEKARAAWAAQTASSYAVVLDNEVISTMIKPSTTTQLQMSIMCPAYKKIASQLECARQISGRLAAPMPIRLVVLK